ncbi:MAG: acetamidase, partial [Acidobacteriaceae bacterium]|nr:acetamidase [Acidobacteriaceae bacterium]
MKCTVVALWLLIVGCLRVLGQNPSFNGRWILIEDFFGTPRYLRLQVEQNGSKISGELNGDKL